MACWLSGYVTWIAYLEAMERVGGMGSNPRNKVAYHTTTTTTTMTSSTSSSDHHDLHARMVLLWPQNPQPTPQPFQTTQPIPLHTHLIPQVHLSLINPIHAVASTRSLTLGACHRSFDYFSFPEAHFWSKPWLTHSGLWVSLFLGSVFVFAYL